MNCIKSLTIVILAIVLFNSNSFSQDLVSISRLQGSVEFDGLPFEKAWKDVKMFPLTMYAPIYGNEPGEMSEVMIGYDNDFLWVGARLFNSDASMIVSSSKKRDETSKNSDSFGIILDSFDDNENALAFFTMPSGLRLDYSISNDATRTPGGGGPQDQSNGGEPGMNVNWNSYWDVKTSIDDKGWYVEMRIPFSSLRFQTSDNLVKMGLIINRSISYNNEIDTYPAIDPKFGQMASGKPSLAQTISLNEVKPKKPVYISPYLLGGFARDWILDQENTNYIKTDKPELNAGLDVKYGITSNLTLDVTANTDFAQVEADDQQVNLTRFSLFFPEKRMFFQERASIFSFKLGGSSDLFYSRKIGIVDGNPVKILGGVRLIGRVGKWDLGAMDMQTGRFDSISSENFGVLRLRRQVINQNSYIGGILTSKLGANGTYNTAYGFDGIIKVIGNDYLDFKFSQSFDNEAANKTFSLDPTFMSMNWERRSEEGFAYNGSYIYSGEVFNPDMGFMQRSNYQGFAGGLQYGWMPDEKSKFINYKAVLEFTEYHRLIDGGLESFSLTPGYEFLTKNGTFSKMGIQYSKEGVLVDYYIGNDVSILAGDYSFLGFQTMVQTPRTKQVSAMINFEGGEFYDGNKFSFMAEPMINISSSLQLSGTYMFNKVDFSSRDQKLRNHIVRMKLLYMLSTKLSMSAYVQYNNLGDDFVGNFRLRFNPREGNDFYLVYNEGRTIGNLSAVPELPSFNNRTVLLKYTYTFRLNM